MAKYDALHAPAPLPPLLEQVVAHVPMEPLNHVTSASVRLLPEQPAVSSRLTLKAMTMVADVSTARKHSCWMSGKLAPTLADPFVTVSVPVADVTVNASSRASASVGNQPDGQLQSAPRAAPSNNRQMTLRLLLHLELQPPQLAARSRVFPCTRRQ